MNGRKRVSSESHLRDAGRSKPDNRRTDMAYVNAVRQFEAASVHFRKQQYTKAKEIFEKLLAAPYPEIIDRARLHLHLCDQKLEPAALSLKRVDHYLLGVAELNARNVEEAIHHLTKADRSAPNKEHIRYALAAAHAVQGNADAALEHLKAAVRLRPQNSYQARHDQDFESLATHPVFRSLVGSDTTRTASAAV